MVMGSIDEWLQSTNVAMTKIYFLLTFNDMKTLLALSMISWSPPLICVNQ